MSWLLAGLLLLLTAGFAKITTVIVNRLLAISQPKWVIGLTELTQFLLIPLYLWLLFQQTAAVSTATEPGSIAGLCSSLGGKGLVLVGVIGLVLLARSILAFQWYRPPNCMTASDGRIIDFREDNELQPWQSVLVGPGPMRRDRPVAG